MPPANPALNRLPQRAQSLEPAVALDDEAEAICIANNTKYGLAAYVWTANLSTGMRMAKALCSSVRINAAAPIGEGAGLIS